MFHQPSSPLRHHTELLNISLVKISEGIGFFSLSLSLDTNTLNKYVSYSRSPYSVTAEAFVYYAVVQWWLYTQSVFKKNIKQLPSHYRLCIGMGCRSRPSTSRLVSINAARCVISEGCYLYSVQPDSIWSCLHRVCRLRVRDCPFPPRINNKIIITKSTNTTKASFSPSYIVFSFFFSPSHTRTKQGDISKRREVRPGMVNSNDSAVK